MRFMKALLVVVGLVLLVLGARGIHYLTHRPEPGAQAVADHPMPQLFEDAAMAPYTLRLGAQATQATTLMTGWWSSHGTSPQDKQFIAWLRKKLPSPPSSDARKAETARLAKLARTRNPYGTKAGQWLELYGGRDLWLYYGQQQAAHLSDAVRHARHKQLGKLLTMGKALGTSIGTHRRQPAPFLIDPGLRPGRKAAASDVCPCSYPTGADVAAAAAHVFLGFLYPGQAAVYRQMDQQFEFTQLYFGDRLPSDVEAGTLVGDMLGEYFLVTRADGSPQQVTAALAGSGSTAARSGGAPGPTAGPSVGQG